MSHLLTISDMIESHARLKPNKLATRDFRRSFTFSELNVRASNLAAGLMESGLKKGDRVAVLAYNRAEWLEIYVGIARAGLVVVPINFRLTPGEIKYILEDCEVSALVVQDQLKDRIEEIRNTLSIQSERYFLISNQIDDQWTDYESLLTAQITPCIDVQVKPEDLFGLMYTSGTTGKPKGAIRLHNGNMMIALATALEFEFTDADTALLVMPMCHANSLYFMMTFVYLGATIVIDDHQSFDPEALLHTFSKDKITFTSLVPTHYILMLGLSDETKNKYDVTSISKLLISSAPARKDTKLEILDYFKNSKLFELYGSTEAGWVTLLRPHEQIDRLGSVGREWAGSGAIKLLDKEGIEVPDGQVGELFSRTSYVFDGYWKNETKTAEAFRGEWCSVGDMARRESDGYIYLVDRKSNMIISGGENIYPSEVEGVIGSHVKVKDVAVVGIPDEKWGESVVAVVVLHVGELSTVQEIRDWCKKNLAGYKRPRHIVFISDSEMPRNATGKILHRVLREKYLDIASQKVDA